jgi:hypothetical protein
VSSPDICARTLHLADYRCRMPQLSRMFMV